MSNLRLSARSLLEELNNHTRQYTFFWEYSFVRLDGLSVGYIILIVVIVVVIVGAIVAIVCVCKVYLLILLWNS